MYSVSNSYKDAIYAPARSIKGRVTFDISDITAAGDVAAITAPAEYVLSDKNQLVNKKRQQGYNIVTWEPNRFRLDGSFSFADEVKANNKEIGFVSDALSGADCIFSPAQAFTIEFGNDHSSAAITITFDPLNNEYATDFNVTAYDSADSVIASTNVVNNTQALCIVSALGDLVNYRMIKISIVKWCKPYRRCRICEIDFGTVKVYEDNNLIRMGLVEEVDLTSSTLPSPEFKFTVDNSMREFNILNPIGFYRYLQQRQRVDAELGLDLGGIYEYVPLGNYLLWEWQSDEGSLTATFTARTYLDTMAGFDYENLTAKTDYSLYNLAVDIFTMCGITNYQVDAALATIPTNGIVAKTDCKSVLQMIVLAGCTNIFVDREGKIILKVSSQSIGTAIDRIDMDNMYNEAQIELDKVVKNVLVSYFADLATKADVTVNNAGVASGDTLKLENNTLINTEAQATNVANWLLRQKNNRAIYKVNWRGNPAHELDDVIDIENSYGIDKSVYITKNDISYEGYLSAKTEARGATDI